MSGYIKDQKHFLNYINKMARDAGISDVYPAQVYIENVYEKGMADDYAWAVRNDRNLLTREGLIQWLSNPVGKPIIFVNFERELTGEFIRTVEELDGIPGVYSFYNQNDVCLYIGMSENLGRRVVSSFDRFRNFGEPIYMRYCRTDSASDAALLEIYYITTTKPPFNSFGVYPDSMSLELVNPPSFGKERILCNRVVGIVDVGGEQ